MLRKRKAAPKAPTKAKAKAKAKAGPAKESPKVQLRDELARILSDQLETFLRSHQAASEGAVHEEARPEDDKDTRAIELSYLARGHATRVTQLQAALAALRSIPLRDKPPAVELGSLVELENDSGRRLKLFVVPDGGGTALANGKVQAVTPRSPLGQQLMGKEKGDVIELQRGKVVETSTILAVR